MYLAKEKIRAIIKDNNFFISYSDINWKWNFNNVKKYVENKKITIFSHKGFHPHLETDAKSDFFLCSKKGEIKKVSEKKSISEDYKKDYLAIGCYFFENFKYFENFFNLKKFKKTAKKKEIYIINLLNFCLKNKIKINHFNINEFVHLGVPSQYENFLYWKNILSKKFDKSLN